MPTVAEVRGKWGAWLLDVTIGGQTFRFSDRAVSVSDTDGNPVAYQPGLEPVSWSLAKAGPEASIGLTVSSDHDWAKMAAAGISLERCSGVLRRWFPGQSLEAARIVLRGITQRVEYGPRLEPLTFSLATLPVEQSDILPPPQAVVSSETFPVILSEFDEKIEGASYPVIIGAPGDAGGSADGLMATPGLLVDYTAANANSRVLIAGHAVQASTVTLYDATDGGIVKESRTVQLVPDGLGRQVSVVDFSGAAILSEDVGRKWYVGWNATNGGLVGFDGGILRGAGDVIWYFLTRYTRIPVDVGRMRAETSRLNRYKIDTYINRSVDAWTWLQQEVIPLLPVLQRETSQGLFFQFIKWDADSTDAVAEIDADTARLDRVGSVKLSGSEIHNEVTVSFAPFATSQRYRKRKIVTADYGKTSIDGQTTTDARVTGSRAAQLSQRLYGVRPLEIQTSAVWDEETAGRIALDKVAQYALPKRAISYEGGSELEGYDVGSIVLLTDSEIYVDRAVALITDIRIGNRVRMSLLLLDATETTGG